MFEFNRRAFLGSSLLGIAASSLPAFSPHRQVFGQNAAASPGSGPNTLFLTWQQDPTTTMTIQWVGSKTNDDVSIQYAPLGAEVWQTGKVRPKPFPDTDLAVHRCELLGLRPGSEYQFQIGGASTLYRFRTMPAKATDVIQFVSGGDCGVDQHAIGTNILAAKQEPYFALIGGDLAYDNGRAPETFLTFLRNYSQHMVDPKGRLIPMLTCIGNHEVNGGFRGTRENAGQYLSVFDGLFAEKTFSVLDVGDYLSLVLLDTGHIAPVKGEQTSWLESVLKERQDCPHLIVANHVPAYPSYRSPETVFGAFGTGAPNRKHWCPLFERYKVEVVLEHHDHTFKRTHPLTDGTKDRNGILYLGDGSWGKLRAPKGPEERPYLAAVSQAYHLSVHRMEGADHFHVALEESGRVADVCMTSGKRASPS